MAYQFMHTCPACGTKNRVPAKHLSSVGRCGSCKGELAPLGKPLDVGEFEFEEIIGAAQVPVLVDFWAEWCGPCKMVAPEVNLLAREMAGRVVVLKVDTEANPELGARYRVTSIPNFMVFVGGRAVSQHAGASPRSVMRRWVEAAAG